MRYLGITEEGNCLSKGYKKQVSVGPLGADVAEHLKHMSGPCQGMTLMEFQKTHGPNEVQSVDVASTKAPLAKPIHKKAVPRDPFTGASRSGKCKKNMIPYEAFYPQYPGVCFVFCVPEGKCEGIVQLGHFYGIKGQGNCKTRGYTKFLPYGPTPDELSGELSPFLGPCRRMRLMFDFGKPQHDNSSVDLPAEGSPYKGSPYEARPIKKPHDDAPPIDPLSPLVPLLPLGK